MSGNTILVGAYYKTVGSNAQQGAAYIFVENNGTWSQQAELTAADGTASGWFGYSVSLSGNTAVVGAWYSYSDYGAAYVFTESGGTWTQQAKLTPPPPPPNVEGYFGHSVSISGNTIAVGDDASYGEGAAYVFTESAGTWSQQAKLTAADWVARDSFGSNISVNGNTIVVSAYHINYRADSYQGTLYVFVKSGATWPQQAELTASDGDADDYFGSVSLSGNIALVSNPDKTVNGNLDQGAVYVFVESGGAWTQQAKLTSADGTVDSLFGIAVSVDGSTALVGAPRENVVDYNFGGAAYVFPLLTSAVVNPSFEQGSSSPVSFTGVEGGGASAATGWSIWNNYSGTTMTELCTAASCPSGSVPPAPANAAQTLHVTTTSASSGVYQIFPSTSVVSAFLWLKVVSGTALVELFGPGGNVVKTMTGTGVLWLPANGAYNEIAIYSLNSGVTEFYADDVVLSAEVPANPPELTQVSPTSGPVGTLVTLTGTGFGAAQETGVLTINGTVLTPTAWSDTSIQVPVPADATTGNVVVTVSGASSNGMNFTVTPAAVTAVPANPNFESGATTVVSFTGTGSGGASAATNWSIWNIDAGTTTTELCTASSCPSGSTPPAPVDGTQTLHVTTTAAYSGVYQHFPQTPLVGATLWLKVIGGAVTVTLMGPNGSVAVGATGTGFVTVPANGDAFNEITIYSEDGPAEFYVDAVTLTAPPVTNPSFEQGSSSAVSSTGVGNLGQSAATGWYVFNGASGTTTTDRCNQNGVCPTFPAGPIQRPVEGEYTLHVVTTSGVSGVYQTFRDTVLLSGALWLHVVSGSVTVELFGPSGPLSATVGSSYSGGVLLPANGGVFNEILIASSGSGPAEFYVDAVTLSPTIGTLANPSFELGSTTPVSTTVSLAGHPSAATGWSMWNNTSGTTTTELCSASSCPSGSVPPATAAGTKTLHVTTTCGSCGVYQLFPQTELETAALWLHVVSGTVRMQLLGPGPAVIEKTATGSVSFLPIDLNGDGGSMLYKEIAIESYGGAAEFYIDAVGVAP